MMYWIKVQKFEKGRVSLTFIFRGNNAPGSCASGFRDFFPQSRGSAECKRKCFPNILVISMRTWRRVEYLCARENMFVLFCDSIMISPDNADAFSNRRVRIEENHLIEKNA
jgi:hypothetical protein